MQSEIPLTIGKGNQEKALRGGKKRKREKALKVLVIC